MSISNEKPAVTFDEVADMLVKQGSTCHPSEIHGMLCGQLASGRRLTLEQWLQLLSGLTGKTLEADDAGMASRLYKRTLVELDAADFAISLLLPDEDEALAQRTEALGLWCQSFLSGFGEGLSLQPQTGQAMEDEVESTLSDLSAIAQIQCADDDNNAAERDWLEVTEYVRMAVLLIFATMTIRHAKPSRRAVTLH